jgi:hypothetical protein
MTPAYEELFCITCGYQDYSTPPDYDRRRREQRALVSHRGYAIPYVADEPSHDAPAAFVEPTRLSRYRLRCPHDGEGMVNSGGRETRDKKTGKRAGTYRCHQRHVIRVVKDTTGAPVSWS